MSATLPFVLPAHCICCGAYLMGSRTVHTDDCEIGKLIKGWEESLKTPEGRAAFLEGADASHKDF